MGVMSVMGNIRNLRQRTAVSNPDIVLLDVASVQLVHIYLVNTKLKNKYSPFYDNVKNIWDIKYNKSIDIRKLISRQTAIVVIDQTYCADAAGSIH